MTRSEQLDKFKHCLPKYYLNLSVADIDKEIWKQIPGYEDYYEISCFGRVRSMERIIPHPRLGSQYIKQRILTQKIIEHRNIKTGIPSIDLQVCLTMDGQSRHCNVRRLVYSAFIKKLNYRTDQTCVVNKNGNGFDCRIENIGILTVAEKSIRAYKRKRVVESYLKHADRTKWRKPYGGATRRKSIGKFSLSGKLLKRFMSVTEASLESGIGEKEIINVAKNKYSQWKGVVWKYL